MLSKKATYIVGRAGSGKSELIKSIWKIAGKKSVILDPHGDLAEEIAHFDDVVMIAPHRKRFVINPFDIQDKSEDNRALVAQEITDILVEMIRDIGISSLMETISYPIIYTLLKLPYADFKMFCDCIDPDGGKARLASISHLVEPIHASIWNKLEKTDTYDTSKQSIFNRLQGFLNKKKILESVCGRDDFECLFDPKSGIKNGSIVVSVPIPELGEDVAITLGRFFMARMLIWAKRRKNIPPSQRTPVYFFIDEFQNFMTETTAKTLDQFGRKFGLLMTLAHQHIQQLSTEIKGSVMANTPNKIAGLSNTETRVKLANEMRIDPEELAGLKTGFWMVSIDGQKASLMNARMVRGTKNKIDYIESQNGTEIIDGWDGHDKEQNTFDSSRRETNHEKKKQQARPRKEGYTPKFDI
jgi:energy-coupling factor transporter ATP-binding protein EcfA2